MPPPERAGTVEVAVGGVAVHDGKVLLVRRAQPPDSGAWSIPGGRVEFGEDLREALVREFVEETGLEIVVTRFVNWYERVDLEPDPPYHFVILDFEVDPLDPNAGVRAGTDAAEVRWVPLTDLETMDLATGLRDLFDDVGLLAAPPIAPFEI